MTRSASRNCCNPPPVPDGKGFTLMEILIAILILGVVITSVLTSFNMVFSSTEALDRHAALYETARTCLARMVSDLEQLHVSQRPLYRAPGYDDPPDPYRIEGVTEDLDGTSFAQIRFVSRSHIPPADRGENRLAQIWYYVMARKDGQLVVKRSDRLYPYPELEKNAADAVLCENVKSLAFTFTDADGTEFENWNSDAEEFGYATPQTVKVRLEVASADQSHVFETMVRLPVLRNRGE